MWSPSPAPSRRTDVLDDLFDGDMWTGISTNSCVNAWVGGGLFAHVPSKHDTMLCCVMLSYVTLCDVYSVTSCHVMSCHVMSCHVMSCHGTARHGTARHATSCSVLLYRFASHRGNVVVALLCPPRCEATKSQPPPEEH